MAIKRFFPNINVPVTAMNSPAMTRNSQVMPRTLTLTNHHVQLQTAPNSLKKFNPVNKVFEDKETGVICYRDERGELICEGYDEGPRLSWQQEDVKLEDLVEKGLDYKSMNLSTEALIVMRELKRLNSTGSIISS
ncbi:hypothetical protein IEQ34_010857 [Dendrobium chrysotoxum]|uniref:Uncharacterized protein n=1 Tax=Dendrobium chrysotoxum TaxID=161865 RepID=A0AAV7GWM7_DENCH|nr:hypothetical protein IEQ34_010857 [Dendrobium chrysotoxum]